MALYMLEFGYNADAWTRLIQTRENREEAVGRILEEAGCKLHSIWYTFGENDGFALMEAPDNVTAGGLAIAVSSSGAFSKFETHVLMTQDELLDALEKAAEVSYAAPGAAVHA